MKVNTNTQSYVNTRKENESLQHQLNMIQNNKKSNEEMIRKQKLSDLQSEQKTNISSNETHYADKYLLVTGDHAINWHDAELHCQTKYNTNLASIHSQTDHKDSEKICQSVNSRETCWIGSHDVKNEGIFIWSDGTNNNIEFWGTWEPTSDFDGSLGDLEDCVHIAPFKNNRWNDLPCNGDANNIEIKSFLCKNPSYDDSKGCACNCDVNEALADIVIRITAGDGAFGSATIHITECWLGKVCGLCGEYDHNRNNDLRLPLNSDDISAMGVEEILSIDNVQRPYEMDDDAWERTNRFGDSWLDISVPVIAEQGSPEIIVKGDCLMSNATQTLCTVAYEQDCDAMCTGNPDVFVEVWDSCLYDACAACSIDHMTKDCLQPLTIYCSSKCEDPILPTWPTKNPTTIKPTRKPTNKPTRKPSRAPTPKPSPAPTYSPTEYPTYSIIYLCYKPIKH